MRKIKNHPVSIGTKVVVEDGVVIAEYDFCRDVRVVNGRYEYRFSGQARYADGRVADLSNFCWAADVAKYFRNGLL